MRVKLSEDVISLSGLKINSAKVANHARDSHRPVLPTSRERGVAVVQALDAFENGEEDRAFLRAVATGMMDVQEGREMPLSEVMTRLGLE